MMFTFTLHGEQAAAVWIDTTCYVTPFTLLLYCYIAFTIDEFERIHSPSLSVAWVKPR
jgi:hypothetical protein